MYFSESSFFFNATASTEIYTYCHTLSRHDALPISTVHYAHRRPANKGLRGDRSRDSGGTPPRHSHRDGAQVHGLGFPCGAPSGGLAIRDPLNRKPIDEPREHIGASSPCRHVELQFLCADDQNQAHRPDQATAIPSKWPTS